MSILNNVNSVLHRIRVKLYPNYLPQVGGNLMARTLNEAFLSIEQVCAAMKERGGYTGNYENLVENVRQFFDETAYQLCDGFGVNMGYYSIHPNIGGTFNSSNDSHDHRKHPINFKFRTRGPLRELAKHIVVDVIGLADSNAFIDEFIDTDEQSVNNVFTPGNMFSISGNKIKILGENPDCGLYFVPVEDASKAVKVERIAENSPSRIIGIAPNTDFLHNKLEIRTQYSGSSSSLLKSPRVIESSFILETFAA